MDRSALMTRTCIFWVVLLPVAASVVGNEREPVVDEPAASQPAPQEETKNPPLTTQPTTTQPTTSQPATTQTTTTQPIEPVVDDASDIVRQDAGVAGAPKEIAGEEGVAKREIINSAAIGSRREPDPPGYVRSVARHGENLGLQGLESYDWLDLGIQQRTRFELRDDYYRADLESGEIFPMRSRAYLGVREVLDPFRMGFEFQDSRRFGDALDDRSNVDEADILQLFGELYFRDVAGEDYPLRFRAGRMSFDSIDRRLVARNRWRNTTNAFDGFRLTLGQRTTDWQFDLFAMMPVERRRVSRDRSDEEEWLYGMTAYWRGWSPNANLRLYYFILDRDDKDPDASDDTIHTIGLHGFGLIGNTGLDYDFNTAFQFGEDGDLKRRAFAMHGEVGYTFTGPYTARVAGWVNYASGDRDPDDDINESFDRLYGASHTMYGYSDLFTWQNMVNPTAYFSFSPAPKVRLETFYRAYWLASSTDAWPVPGLRDPTGESGSFIGQEIDLRGSYQFSRHLAIQIGYAHFMPGTFVSNTLEDADDSDFFYVQFTLRL